MGNIPILTPQKVIKILIKLGFKEVRQKGSHKQFSHPDGRFTTIPFHKGKDISPILLKKIVTDIKLTIDEFLSTKV